MDDRRVQQAHERILKNPAVQRILSAVSEGGLPPLYLVGGALRDGWLGFELRDFDFVVPGEARNVASKLAGRLNARYVLLDEDWGVARLVWSAPDKKAGALWLDFASMRGKNIHEDLWQRDFTCNALALLLDEESEAGPARWEDPTEGLKDLRSGLIRMVHPARLREDPLRILRAFRFACTLQFDVEAFTLQTIRQEGKRVLSAAPERIREELFKIFVCPRSLACIRTMDGIGLLTTIFPELEGLKGLEQGEFHHLDAWNHTLEAYRSLEDGCTKGFEELVPWEREQREWMDQQKDVLPLLKMAALFHDIGKPSTRTVDQDGKPHFYGHAEKGMKAVANIMRRLRVSRRDQEKVKKWVRYHMGPVHMVKAMEKNRLTEKAKIRFLRRLGNDVPGVLLVSLADLKATGGPNATAGRIQSFSMLFDSLLQLYFHKDAASLEDKHLVTGQDLIDALDIPPGPRIGRLLRLLEEARVEGKVKTRSEAVELARSLLEKLG